MPEETNNETTALETEMRGLVEKYVVPEVGKAREAAEKVQEIHKDLMSKWERGSNPDDQAVKDLEAQKAEREAELSGMRDEIRGLKLELRQNVSAPATDDPSAFYKQIVPNVEEIKAALKQYGNLDLAAQARAITTTTISSAGSLTAEQENQFLDWLIAKQLTLSRVRVRTMRSGTANLDELVTANRQMTAGVEATAPSAADGVSFAKRSLTTIETVWAEDLSKSFLEDNIERANAEDHIMQDLALAFGNDHNDLFWNGDDSDSDAFVGINDGIITVAKADGSVVDYDASSDTTAEEVLAGMLKNLAFSYAMRPGLTFFVPYKTSLYYADELTDRGTVFADQVQQNGLASLRYFGLPVVGEPHLNVGTADEGVLTFAENLVWGVQRGITLESMWQPRKRAVEITISARTDQNYAKSEAVVLADSIASTLR